LRTTLGSQIELVTSGSRGWAKYYADSGSLFIRAQNINSDVLRLHDASFVRLPNKAEGLRTRVQKDDILVTITGANITKSALVECDLDDAYASQHVALVRLTDHRLARFLFHWIVSVAHGRKQLLESAYGQGKPGLNLSASPQGQDSEPGLNRSDAVTNLLGGTLVLSSATV
jgi:type I restriction enzyme S subunit